jgi:DNA end-binding protein Ku
MARAIWTGSISFGLLNVPVKLYSAVSSRAIRFRELRESDGSRIRHKRVAEEDGKEVAYEEIVKGYEISPDQYVVMTRDELEALDPKKTKAIEIEDFVDLDEIDPIYFNQPYYIGPASGAERAYALLAQAMSEQRKVAIARFVMRNKESLAAIRANNDGTVLTLATMRFADEVVPADQLDDVLGDAAEVEPRKREIDMAKALIDSLSSDFDPTSYKDEYREELMSLIERKAAGEKIVSADAEAPKPTKAPDLMAALEESLAAIKGEDLGGGGEKRSGSNGGSKSSSKSKSKSSSSSSKSKSSSSSSRSKSSSKAKSKSKPRAKAAK